MKKKKMEYKGLEYKEITDALPQIAFAFSLLRDGGKMDVMADYLIKCKNNKFVIYSAIFEFDPQVIEIFKMFIPGVSKKRLIKVCYDACRERRLQVVTALNPNTGAAPEVYRAAHAQLMCDQEIALVIYHAR